MASALACDMVPYLKTALRVTSDLMDEEVLALAEAALADMERVGIPRAYLEGGGPLVRVAVTCFCKARFGGDNPDAERFEDAYRSHVCDLMNALPSIEAAL